jgi:hypothetical protein
VRDDDAVVGVSYGITELRFGLDVAFNAIHKMYQSSMKPKN